MLLSNKNIQYTFDVVINDSGIVILYVNCKSEKITSIVTGILMRLLIIVGLTFVFTEVYSNKNGNLL